MEQAVSDRLCGPCEVSDVQSCQRGCSGSTTLAGRVVRVDKHKYEAIKKAFLAVMPKAEPGLTVAELKQQLLPLLPEDLFPGGDKAGWWLKGVQLDLEAKAIIVREKTPRLLLR